MQITDEIFRAYIACPYKAFLRFSGQSGTLPPYTKLCTQRQHTLKHRIQHQYSSLPSSIDVQYRQLTRDILKSGHTVLLNCTVQHKNLVAKCDFAEKIDEYSPLGAFSYRPILIHGGHTITLPVRQHLAFQVVALSHITQATPQYGTVIFSPHAHVQRIDVTKLVIPVRNMVAEITKLINTQEAPPFLLNTHCPLCEFTETCRTKALEEDDLSLLRGISRKEILKQRKRGIFSVAQYASTFRTPRSRKRVQHAKPHYSFALKALAIREQKIVIAQKPNLPPLSHTEIYLDIEGIPEEHYHYLIGMILVHQGQETHYSFWGNSVDEEPRIIREFLDILTKHESFTLYHYGRYEQRFFKALSKWATAEQQSLIETLTQNVINILGVLYGSVYFPTHSNSLKEIARYVGFQWTHMEASGLQSLVWRAQWEHSHALHLKQTLMQYNLDDCAALQRVTAFLRHLLTETDHSKQHDNITTIETLKLGRTQGMRFGDIDFCLDDLGFINQRAYFEYQRTKVQFRSDSRFAKIQKRQTKHQKQYNMLDKRQSLSSPTSCQQCGSLDLQQGRARARTVVDIRFLRNGVKKRVIRYSTRYVVCQTCQQLSLSESFLANAQQKYGYSLRVWIAYQSVCHHQSHGQIQQGLVDLFNIYLDRATMYRVKSLFIQTYQPTYQQLLEKLLQHHVIYIDETKVHLQDRAGYVWVLTNGQEVYCVYKNSREGEFLHELLNEYTGVVVSDFYGAYDSLPCPQQKCLIHLVRDLNTDLSKQIFNEELQTLAQDFSTLLKTIIATIDRYGLKHYHLNKHHREVERFFTRLLKQEFVTEVAQQYQKRFSKNREKLFTFLSYDNVSWNNNAAEHVIKYFAIYRDKENGHFTEKGLANHLILFSLYHSCRYMEVNFLDFLLSRNLDLSSFIKRGCARSRTEQCT